MQFFGGGRQRGRSGGLNDKFEKFTEHARRVIALAQEEAQRLNHNYMGTEHLLLGLIREGDGVAAKVLVELGVRPYEVRARVIHIIGRGDRIVLGDIGLTPRAKKVIELAVDESRRLNQHYVGTEHLLLGLVREGEGIAAKVLESLGVNLQRVRTTTLRVLSSRAGQAFLDEDSPAQSVPTAGGGPSGGAGGPKNNVVTCRLDNAALDAIDALVEAGIRSTRSDAAAWLISAGIEAHRPLFERVYATVTEIRQLRVEAQAIAQQVHQEATNGGDSNTPNTSDASDVPEASASTDATDVKPSDTPKEDHPGDEPMAE